ncbi:MAG: cobyrinate a,c-diamide synthase [Alphaproteobacteria bacterium]|nr:cobyrinate a,c-diamide synthase [Alphaproteobacteria bacterium]
MSAPGLVLAAPASGSGKTVLTMVLARHFARQGLRVAPAKVGPDYIDPAFLSRAAGRPAVNLDPWAMRPGTLAALVAALGADADLVLVEGVMGLFDGAAADGRLDAGSTADLAAITGWPVVLVVDATGMAASVGALVAGFARHRPDVTIAGVVFNRTGSAAHRDLLATAVAAACPEVELLGDVPRDATLGLPSRHLGLVQAAEHVDLDARLDAAAARLGETLDLAALRALARPARDFSAPNPAPPVAPPGQRIALASDIAFAFAYTALIDAWRRDGAEIIPFSPLADEAPDAKADAVFLPGGYPELHAGRLAAAGGFLAGLRGSAARGAAVYGECGGYMVLGRFLIDAEGNRHAMAGLLALEASFAARRLSLGYRRARLTVDGPLGRAGVAFRGHEFHYATVTAEGPGTALFVVADAAGHQRGAAGLVAGRVAGSFLHLVDRAAGE